MTYSASELNIWPAQQERFILYIVGKVQEFTDNVRTLCIIKTTVLNLQAVSPAPELWVIKSLYFTELQITCASKNFQQPSIIV